MPPPPKRALPQKEQALFKTLLGLYETRQNKKAVKTADQILKKVPEHGETMSMKGLIFTGMNRKEEGLELIRKGVRLDLTSHICWHVFGIAHKADKNYEEALKCYTQALRFDKENMNILRDAATLQMQLRLYEGLQETRQTILRLRPTLRQSWVGLAVAYHLGDRHQDAKTVIEHYNRTVKEVPNYDYEHSELQLYYVRILQDMKLYEEALGHLDANARSRTIIDKTSILFYRARLLSQLERKDESDQVWRALLEQNSECYGYYRELFTNKDIDIDNLNDTSRSEALKVLSEFSDQNLRTTAPRRLSLKIAVADDFASLARSYIRQGLSRGIPSLFVDLKSLYTDNEKHRVIQEIVEDFRAKLEKSQTLDGDAADPTSSDPTIYIWTLYFLAQHYSLTPKTIPLALELLDKALSHTPTLPELLMIKARTLKRAGDPIGAAQCMEEARALDLQDRFLNTKAAKYQFRTGQADEANRILGLFTKKDAVSPGADLEEMQSLFFYVEEGDAYDKLGKLNLALKRYHGLEKTFNDIWDDQIDFHMYALRKYTVSMYLLTIEFEDGLRGHPAYIHAALAASRIYMRLHDDPTLASSSQAALSEDGKKAKKKAKKAELKQEKKPAAVATTKNDPEDPPPPKDEDPDGVKLLTASDPLEQAAKLLRPLELLHHRHIDAWAVSYDVHIRRKKYLLALRALNTARKIAPDHPIVHERIVNLKHTVSTLISSPVHVHTAITSALQILIPGDLSLEAYNTQYLQNHGTSARAQLAAARSIRLLRGAEGQTEAEELVLQILRDESDADIQTCLEALPFLESRRDEFCTKACARFPLSTLFKSPAEQAVLRSKILSPAPKDGEEVVS